MPWIQDHLLPLLDLLPTILEPEDEVPNFHRLRLRMALIERQQFVLGLQAWVEDNDVWLAQQGLSLQSGRQAGEHALTFYESFAEDRAHEGTDKRHRHAQIDALVGLLDLHTTPFHQPYIEILVEDLNHIRWDPTRVRELLAFKIADAIPDPYAWLGRHSAARQSRTLKTSTTVSPPSRPGRPRL